jgi:sugar/nucleoside kinase (ribokinase family)
MGVDLITVGGCTVDIVHAADGSTAGPQLGGSAIYAAIGARLWDLRPGICAFQGTGLPEGWRELLADLGLNLDGLVPVELRAAAGEFTYASDGSRTEHMRGPGVGDLSAAAISPTTWEPIRRLRLMPDHVPPGYRDALGAHLAPMPYRAQLAMAEHFGPRALVTLDPYPHVMIESSDDELSALLQPLAAFLPSREEVTARYPGRSLDEVLRAVARLGSRITSVKRGPSGSVLYDPGRRRSYVIPAVPVVARDPTGAGDAFCGGFLAGRLQHDDILEAAVYGTVAASFVVEDFSVQAVRRWSRSERDRRYRWVKARVSLRSGP